MLIAQSGGPTVVINQTLVGAIKEARRHAAIRKVYGSLHGIQGILGEDFIDLGRETDATLEAVAATPSSMLGSVRKKPTSDDCLRMLEIIKKNDIRYFFYIGGNDSADTTFIINREAMKSRYDFRCYHICKTIDNDLRENDHTPGFGSGARFVALAFMGDNLDNRALPGVKINIVMGRHAGFLTAASALARHYPDDGPHLIYLPERAFSMRRFVEDVKRVVKTHGRCVVAVSEGIAYHHGKPILGQNSSEMDSHGNIQLSGTGALGDRLAREIREKTDIQRVRADTFGYLQRSFAGVYSEVDAREAREAGRKAVQFSLNGPPHGSVAIKRKPGKKYQATCKRVPLKNVAKETRHMPDSFIGSQGNDVTAAFIRYARPLVGKLPTMGRFTNIPVPPVD
jgi:6-phosphofructokinase